MSKEGAVHIFLPPTLSLCVPTISRMSPLPPTPAELEQLLQLTQDAKITSYFAVAALTFLVFDHILSLDHEIEFVWKRRKSLASYVYLWVGIDYVSLLSSNRPQNRYFTLIITCCGIYTQFEGVSSTLIVATVDVILLLRVWILFGKSRNLLYFLVPLMTVEIGVMLFIAIFTINEANKYVHVGTFLSGCYSLTVPKFFTLYPVPSLVVHETFTMFVMTVHNCKTRLGATLKGRNTMSLVNNTMPLVNLFLRDGIYWFLAVVAVNPPQIIIWAVARPTLTELLIIPSIVVYSIIGSRVLLNMSQKS
ncbi:hypothetical protein B0H19DRAFT_1255378 [Mycena capillaripes]|nr:hypothetical protein B0H19DRAFT_1255378 [Mycena capillaripes]